MKDILQTGGREGLGSYGYSLLADSGKCKKRNMRRLRHQYSARAPEDFRVL